MWDRELASRMCVFRVAADTSSMCCQFHATKVGRISLMSNTQTSTLKVECNVVLPQIVSLQLHCFARWVPVPAAK